jgi:phage shock protein A
VSGENLDNKFAALEGRSVDDELSALKKGMLTGGSSPVAALPEGRPLRDAIDMELDQLRRKARD